MEIHYENEEIKKPQVNAFLNQHGIDDIDEAKKICDEAGIDVYHIVKGIQRICFEDVCYAYTAGVAVAVKEHITEASKVALVLGEALQSFCSPSSVADLRQVGVGHGRLASKLLSEEVKTFAFVAGHESFAAAEGAIGIIESANKVRKEPLKVILNGLGKDAAEIISRVNGFTYVETEFDFEKNELSIVDEIRFSKGNRGDVRCYGANEMQEGVAIMVQEGVDVSISGNATNMVKFQHAVVGTYKKYCNDHGKSFFACASGGGIGRTMNHDEISAGPASYGFTDMLSKLYADATFAGSSSVPAHVEMMGFVGMGNNPMVGATVALSVEVQMHYNK